MAYVAQQRLDGYAEMVTHAVKRKAVFDKRVLARNPGEVVFSKGQLVQIYRSDLDYTFKTDRKLLPKWSPPQWVTSRNLNSYVLERLDGTPIAGQFSARRLRAFIPKEGTKLALEQVERESQESGQETIESASEQEETMEEEETGLMNIRSLEAEEDTEEEEHSGAMARVQGDEDVATQEGGTWSSGEIGHVT